MSASSFGTPLLPESSGPHPSEHGPFQGSRRVVRSSDAVEGNGGPARAALIRAMFCGSAARMSGNPTPALKWAMFRRARETSSSRRKEAAAAAVSKTPPAARAASSGALPPRAEADADGGAACAGVRSAEHAPSATGSAAAGFRVVLDGGFGAAVRRLEGLRFAAGARTRTAYCKLGVHEHRPIRSVHLRPAPPCALPLRGRQPSCAGVRASMTPRRCRNDHTGG